MFTSDIIKALNCMLSASNMIYLSQFSRGLALYKLKGENINIFVRIRIFSLLYVLLLIMMPLDDL